METNRLTDRKREAIVQAAMALFQANGFEGTSMDRVTEMADVSKRTVYNHFPSKEELFAECCRRAWPGGESPLEPYRPGLPLREQLTRFVGQKLKQFSEEKLLGLVRVGMVSILRSADWAQDLQGRLADLDKDTTDWINAAHRDGALERCDPEMAILQLDGLIMGIGLWPQVTMRRWKLGPEEQRKVTIEIVDMFMARYSPDAVLAPTRSRKSAVKQKA